MTRAGSRSTSKSSSRSRSRRRTARNPESLDPASRRRLRRRLLEWYRAGHRDLPWRRTRDPYRVWLSETMLQQTRVETVVPYYERFLARFPTVEALAAADEEDVLREWAGLGYYARARNLKRAAELIARDHGGELPRDRTALEALPGVGRYTTGALLSIAFRERAALVDGNVKRVLARVLAESSPREEALWALAEELVPRGRPDQFNQALMELGAIVCTPRAPRCDACPIASDCAGRSAGDPESFPARRVRPAPRPVRAVAGVLRRRRPRPALLMLRRPSRGLLGGLWELPQAPGDSADALADSLLERTGLRTEVIGTLGELRYRFTHRELTLQVVRLARRGGRLSPRADARWCEASELDRLPLSGLMKKTLALAGG